MLTMSPLYRSRLGNFFKKSRWFDEHLKKKKKYGINTQQTYLFMLSLLSFVFSTPKTPMELAIDFILHDFEMAGHFAIRSLFSFLILIFCMRILNWELLGGFVQRLSLYRRTWILEKGNFWLQMKEGMNICSTKWPRIFFLPQRERSRTVVSNSTR